MAMKFKMISDDDVKTIRAARKALTRIAKKTRRLCDAEKTAFVNPDVDWKPVTLECWRMLDEAYALDIASLAGDQVSFRVVPSGDAAEAIRL